MAFEPAEDYNPKEGLSVFDVDMTSPDTSIGSAMDEAEAKFIKFVEVQVTKMNKKLLFDGKTQPSLYQIDQALMEHEHVMLALTSLYEEARWALNRAKMSWDEWYANKFLEIRNEVNSRDTAASKWYKESEIDYMVTAKYTKERATLKSNIQLADAKVSLFRRLIDSWNSYAFQLGQLSRNGIAEKNSSDLSSNYVNQDPVELSNNVINSFR